MKPVENNLITVLQGEFHVSDRPEDLFGTILGSCVAACIFDPVQRVGGMNHFLLPGSDPRDPGNIKYGALSMERLINALLRRGADRKRLRGKLFGGACVLKSLSNIGQSNADFARRFLAEEGIPLIGECLGGDRGRRVRFRPASGRVQVLRMGAPMTEPAIMSDRGIAAIGSGDVLLF